MQKRANNLVMRFKDDRRKFVDKFCFQTSMALTLNVRGNNFKFRIIKSRVSELKHIWTILVIPEINICLLCLASRGVSVVTRA